MEVESGEPKEVARLIISVFDNQSVRVDGPIADKILSYGMLASAKDAIYEFHQQQGQNKKANGNGIIKFVRGGLR